MLSRTADHLYWMARYMERAGQQAPACCGEAGKTQRRENARSGVFGNTGVNDAL
jgi:A predicted alpha-helical domain with a conserved ER motif.